MALTRVCVDTSAYSHFRRGSDPAVSILSSALWVGVPSVVLGELRTGFLLGSQPEKNESELQQFLRHPVVEVLDIDDEAAQVYAEIMSALRRAGTPIPTNDVWIAAVAAREGATVISYDEHFRLILRVGSIVLP